MGLSFEIHWDHADKRISIDVDLREEGYFWDIEHEGFEGLPFVQRGIKNSRAKRFRREIKNRLKSLLVDTAREESPTVNRDKITVYPSAEIAHMSLKDVLSSEKVPSKTRIYQPNPVGRWKKKLILTEQFLYIRIPKTGSTSFETSLRRYTHSWSTTDAYFHEGINYLWSQLDDRQQRNCDVIATVRNPFSQLLSYYFHRLNFGEDVVHPKGHTEGFYQFVKNTKNREGIRTHCGQLKYLMVGDTFVASKVFPFEAGISTIIADIAQTYGLQLKSVHQNKNQNNSFAGLQSKLDILPEKTVRLILENDEIKRDFEFFGYSTDPKEMLNLPSGSLFTQ